MTPTRSRAPGVPASLAAIASPNHRATLWLPLLRQLTDEVPGWLVIKNARQALDGVGDIDSMARPEDWPAIERLFRMWASEHGLTVVGVCRHIWRGPNLVARDPSDPYLLVLDVKSVRTFRGSALVTVADALALAEMDAAGFRRMRAGGEGVVKLLHNGMTRGARRDQAGLDAKGVVALLRPIRTARTSGRVDRAQRAGPAASDPGGGRGWMGPPRPAPRRGRRARAGRRSIRDPWSVNSGCARPVTAARSST